MTTARIEEALSPVVDAFDSLGIAYHVGGSVASSVYGAARATLDVDVVARLQASHVQPLVRALDGAYYIDEDAVREAIRGRRSFNAIHLTTMIKIDVFVAGDEPFDAEEFARIRLDSLDGEPDTRAFYLKSPEDIVLRKLQWYVATAGVSERQWRDILGVLSVQAKTLDWRYLRHWATRLELADLLEHALADASANS